MNHSPFLRPDLPKNGRDLPVWIATFDVVGDSMHNAELGMALLNQMIMPDEKIAL